LLDRRLFGIDVQSETTFQKECREKELVCTVQFRTEKKDLFSLFIDVVTQAHTSVPVQWWDLE